MAQFRIGDGSVLVLQSDSEIANEHIKSGAAVDADKLEHLHVAKTNFDLAIGGTPVALEEIVYVAKGPGTIRSFRAMLNDTGTSTDVDFDLKKNGSTVLSAAVNITHSDADRTVKSGTLSATTYVAGDVFSISLGVTSSTGAQGPFAAAEFDELAT